MKSKIISVDREKILAGVNKLADAVKVTLGPAGQHVVIGNKFHAYPSVTKDGATVAKEVFLSDPTENDVAQLLKQVALETAKIAGDGTTTATVLAQAIITDGFKLVSSGHRPIDLKRGIDKAVEKVVAMLSEMAISIDLNNEDEFISFTNNIAEISANGDKKIGELVARAVRTSKGNGMVNVLESKTTNSSVETMLGFQFNSGYASNYFINNPDKNECNYQNAYILVTTKRIVDINMIVPILETVASTGHPIIIIADYFSEQVLASLVVNTVKHGMPMIAVKAPLFGENRTAIMNDIAIVTGATLVSDEANIELRSIGLEDLGRCQAISIKEDKTTIINAQGNQDKIRARVEQLKAKYTEAKSEVERNSIRERIAKIAGGVSVIYVGGSSDAEVKEKKDRIDDAIHATNASIEEGIVPGGGIALLNCIKALDGMTGDNENETAGIGIVRKALCVPIQEILNNAGKEHQVIIHKIIESPEIGFGYNARTNEFGNMIEMRVVDPVKVTRVALQNAASIAGLLLTTGCIMSLEKE